MGLDHEAIFKAYPDCTRVDDAKGAFKIDGTPITLEQSAIDAARATINSDYAKVKYKDDRVASYPSVVDQLDLIYHSGIDAWKAKIKETKDKYPKP